MTIKLKLQLLMLVTFLAIGCGVVATAIGFNSVKAANDAASRRALQIRGLTEVKGSALSTVELDPTTADTKQLFGDAEKNIDKWITTVTPLFESADQQKRIGDLHDQWVAYDQKSRNLMDLATHDAKSANDQVEALYHSDFLPMQANIQAAIDNASQRGEEAAARADHISTLSNTLVIALLLFIMAVVVSWIFVVSRSIQRALRSIQHTLQTASESLDLSQRVPVLNRDEIGQTGTAFNLLIERISGVMLTVRDSAESVSLASKEIAAGNVDLSTRTEEQAASLEETAASMEELTSTVRQNADNARHASGLSDTASETAHRGNDVVAQVVGTMQQISASSAKIADITGMIEGIAFQTNILALNAAVEAARAGEQGRGFAVVAGEVRSLAQRAATAAKEIKDLIAISVTTSAQGSELANRAGSTMGEVIGAVSRVTDIMGEIAAASGEQSKGIDQVSQAVTQMDEVTQQNAALVEQAAAAAQSLEQQAVRLKDAIGVFRFAGQPREQSPHATVKPQARRGQFAAVAA